MVSRPTVKYVQKTSVLRGEKRGGRGGGHIIGGKFAFQNSLGLTRKTIRNT